MKTLWINYRPEFLELTDKFNLPMLKNFIVWRDNAHYRMDKNELQDWFWSNFRFHKDEDWETITKHNDRFLLWEIPFVFRRNIMRGHRLQTVWNIESFDTETTSFMDMWLTLIAIVTYWMSQSADINEEVMTMTMMDFMFMYTDIAQQVDKAIQMNTPDVLNFIRFHN